MKVKNILKSTLFAAGTIAGATTAVSADTNYTVKSGDTLNKIANQFKTTAQDLADKNKISNINFIEVGQVIKIEDQKPVEQPSSTVEVKTYTVVAGDTLNKIASKVSVSVNDLVAINKIANPNLIYVGRVLKLSADNATSGNNSSSTTQTANDNSYANQALSAVNALRAKNGLAPVSLDDSLSAKALSRAKEASVAADGLPSNHFKTNGEVVAFGWPSAQAVVDAWYNETNMLTNGTPGHRMWILNPNATKIGFGIVNANGVQYVVGESNVGQY